ncbi:MAG TPA: FMN-binding protein [Planctomycetota bacterium]|nr:FMN-binding protein [Planctomycetota bacterium]
MCSEAAAALLLAAALAAQELPTVAEALELAFPDAKVERTTAVLDAEQQRRIAEQLGETFERAVVFPYLARKDDALAGTAYFDTHRVRAKSETLMVVVGPDGKVARVEVVAFAEPRDYLPKRRFYEQFVGRGLLTGPRVSEVRMVAGASLTSAATVAAVRRVLAVHQALQSPSPSPSPPPPSPSPLPPPKSPK